MGQPVATGVTLNPGAGGAELAKTTHGGFDYQWAFACWWEEVGNSPEVPSLASPFPIQPGTGVTFACTQSGTWNVATVATITNLASLGGQAISMGTGVRDGGTQRVTIATDDAVPVTGTFWQGTQPVSAAALPLAPDAATETKQNLAITGLNSIDGRLVTVVSNTDTLAVVGGGAEATAQRVTIADDSTGVIGATNDDTVSANNSTTSILGISVTFTGTGDDCLGYTTVTILLKANVDSAVDGMTFQFSSDNSNWDDVNTFTYVASEGSRRFQFPVTARYFRVVFTNGGTGQGSFRVQTILHRQNTLTSIHRLVDDISPDRSATLVKAVIAAQSAGTGDYMVVQATAAGNFKVSVEEVNGVEMPVKGTVVHDSPDTGDAPVKVGGVATTSEPGAVADSDLVNAYFDATGHQHVKIDAHPAAGAGAVTATTQRITLASDDPLVAKTPTLGTAVMAASAPSTIATDDTQFGAVGATADVDGNVHGQLRYIGENAVEIHVAIDSLDATASWAASTDASGITQESDNIPSHDVTTSLSIDKTGTATTEASYGKTLGATIDGSRLGGNSNISFYVRHGNYTNVTAVFVRLGTDASNYVEYSFDPAEFSTSLWTHVTVPLHEGAQTGTGLDLVNIDYVAFGVTMTATGNTISDVFFNMLMLHSVTASELSVTSDVTASTVRVSKMGANSNQNVATGAGAVTTGVQRTTLASDDPAVAHLANVVAAVQLIDNTVAVLGTDTYTETTTSGNVIGAVRNDDKATLGDTDNEIVPLQVDAEGALYVNQAAAELKSASGVAAGGTPGADVMIAAVGSKKVLIVAMSLTATSTTVNNVYVDNVDNDLFHNVGNPLPLSMDADGDTVPGIVLNYNPAGWFKTDAVNEAVTLSSDAAEDIAWSISWIETD